MASQAQIEANRANAQRSTGPRTPAGKARAASNSFKHGLYAPKHFQVFNADPNYSAALILNYTEEFQPLTPSEHTLLQQLVHQQIRYQHVQSHYTNLMDYYCAKPGTPKTNLVCQLDFEDALGFERMSKDSNVLPLILRELDRMPTRIRRTMDALRKLIKERIANDGNEANLDQPEPEPIEDIPHIPSRPDSKPKSVQSPANTTAPHPDDVDPALRARLQSLPGNYLWNLLLHYTYEDHPDELAHFYNELETEKAEIEAAEREKAEQQNEQQNYETNPIAA